MSDITEIRDGFDGLGNNLQPADGVSVIEVTIGGIPCLRLIPRNAIPDEAIIYVRGGAFTLGSFKSHGPWVTHLAKATQREILFVDYRLAPKTRYPAGANDVIAAVSGSLDVNPGTSVSIIDDSVGGGLTVTVMPELMQRWAS